MVFVPTTGARDEWWGCLSFLFHVVGVLLVVPGLTLLAFRLFGVPVRSSPRTSASIVATVSHGDRLRASCWAVGDTVSNGFDELPFDDAFTYTSAVWFRVNTPSGPGFVPDVRFGRRGGTDRLGLPSCGGG